ncbi:MAG: gamma carbonic anhydrase family protein [Pseudobdellovibrionaceae bacterium]|jgi:carbonic anhydrase/acetyltransferase-like protein (isoleucine patch superfamily)|nr:gamma carbonic anhydrase family protein [Pseudobdellovibrionaceae bacterium]
MLLKPYRGILPKVDGAAFVADNVILTGDIEIGAESNIWYNVAMRGDVNDIKIGKRTNIQDGTIIHTSLGVQGTYIGDDVTVGHMALLHACTIGNKAFIGMQTLVMDEAVVEDEAMVAAGSLVSPRKRIPKHQLWGGRPARYMRDLTPEEIEYLQISADRYVALGKEYKAGQLS